MTEDKLPNKQDESKTPIDDTASTGSPVPQAEKLEEVIKDLPEPQQERIRHTLKETFQETFMAVFQGAISPKIDPETAKIITESIDKDNEHKFQYLSQRQRNEAEAEKRKHEFAVKRHRDRKIMLWPVLIAVLFLALGGIVTGVYLTATGHEVLGSNLLTAIITGLLAFLAGLGISNFFKDHNSQQ